MKQIYLLAALLAVAPCQAQSLDNVSSDTLLINQETLLMQAYEQSLDSLTQIREDAVENLSKKAESVELNPYFYRLMLPGTYYNRPLHQAMGINWEPGSNGCENSCANEEKALDATDASDQALAQLYVSNPQLVTRTEKTLKQTTALRKDVGTTPVSVVSKLSDKAVNVDLGSDVPDTIALVAKKPNFWKVKGSASLQFTQSFFSDNWYQGGENNYAGIGMLTVEANYDNKQKVQWDNKLEAQLGFQTTTTDDYHKVRVTSNLLRLTSKIGYKAAKNWFYTGQAMTYTQLAPYYEKNKQDWKARFATPLYFTLSVGMDWKYKSKNGKFDLSVYLSPLAYYMTYVGVNRASDNGIYNTYPTAYGLEHADDHFLHKFGPNLTVNSKIQIMKNVKWTSRLYWFSNFHSTLIEWENTLDFTINKYLSAKFYAYPRFDDSSWKYGHKDDGSRSKGGYLMFKEWLSLGISYNF